MTEAVKTLGAVALVAVIQMLQGCGGGSQGDSLEVGTSSAVRQKTLGFLAGSASLVCTSRNGAQAPRALSITNDGFVRLEGLPAVDFNPLAARFNITHSITSDGRSNQLPVGLYLEGISNGTTVSATYASAGGNNFTLSKFQYQVSASGLNETCVAAAGAAPVITWNDAGLNPMAKLPASLTCQAGNGAPFKLVPSTLKPLREDYQLPIDYANPTLVKGDNFSYTAMMLGPKWLHLQVYLDPASIEIDYADAVCI